MKLFHGTTEEAYQSILKNGFCHSDVVWTCSDPNVLYFFRHDLVAEQYELDEQEATEKCFALALESASYTAALTRSTSCNLYVFEFEIDEDHIDLVLPDLSVDCTDSYSVCIDAKLLNSLPHNAYVSPACYAPALELFYIGNILKWEHCPKQHFSTLEQLVIESAIEPSMEQFQSRMLDFLCQPERMLLGQYPSVSLQFAF